MKFNIRSMTFLISVLMMSSGSHAQDDLSSLQSPYLGQTPPGLTAMPFAPGIVNTEEWGDGIIFFQDMNEICVVRWKHTADAPEPENVIFERADNAWRKRAAPEGYCRGSLSPDGQTQYYRAKYKERAADDWSELKSLGPAFEDIRIMGLMSSAKGTLVFDELGTITPGVGATGDGLIRYSRLVEGKREEPKPFGKEINTGTFNAHPFIAPDESYIMWDGERDTGYGDNDIYISFRQQDGSWGEAINLGDKVNTDAEEGGAKITPDGKYLFFNRMVPRASGDGDLQSDLYWIDAKIIETLRPKNSNNTTIGLPYFGQTPPGLTPVIFAPGIVSIDGRSEGAISFSSELTEVYFEAGRENEKIAIYFSKLEGNEWAPIEKADFTRGEKDEEVQPFASPDGKRIYFTAYSSDLSDTGIWYVNRLGRSWSDAAKLDLPINDDKSYGTNQVKSGNLYYYNLSKRKDSYAAYSSGGFPEVTEFEVELDFYHALPSPNEDYLVGHGPNKDGAGREDRDIYVSFKAQDGTWAPPINLGSAVNSNLGESVPTISPDGRFLFFGREEEDGTANIYWVSTEVIEDLRPKIQTK